MSSGIERLRNFTEEQVQNIVAQHGTPVFAYSMEALDIQITTVKQWQMPFGQTIRFAMKANPHPKILQHLYQRGIWIDASSGPEAEAAIAAGIAPEHVMLTTQQLPDNFSDILDAGVRFNACSLHQLKVFCEANPGGQLSLRINPGTGQGANKRLTTGGVNAAFGIWHEYIDQAKQIAADAGVQVVQIHTHIGSGAEPEPWMDTVKLNLQLLEQFPEVDHLSLGGGFKFGRMADEPTLDIKQTTEQIAAEVQRFADEMGRKIHVEIEPGTYLVAPIATLITKAIDVKDTGSDGHTFAIINSGMNDLLRPAMYGAQHPLITVASDGSDRRSAELLVAGHCCESSDMLSLAPGNPEELSPRTMQLPKIGDYICVEGAGAYAAAMRPASYNSFAPAIEVFV